MLQWICVDYHNLFKACEKNNIQVETVIGELTEKGLANGEIHEIRLFIPNYQSATPWRAINAMQCKFGVEVSACPVLTENVGTGMEMKDAVDFEVLKWVGKHLHRNIVPKRVIFVTGDGHFLVSSNEAKRKGKEVEFWSIDPSSVHGIIKRQEEFREIKISPPILLTKENSFLNILQQLTEGKEVSDKDKEKLEKIARMARTKLNRPEELVSATDEASSLISAELGVSLSDSKELLEALMTLGIARIYPATNRVIDIDESSHLFQWLQLTAEPKAV